jgi:hypothetical protein
LEPIRHCKRKINRALRNSHPNPLYSLACCVACCFASARAEADLRTIVVLVFVVVALIRSVLKPVGVRLIGLGGRISPFKLAPGAVLASYKLSRPAMLTSFSLLATLPPPSLNTGFPILVACDCPLCLEIGLSVKFPSSLDLSLGILSLRACMLSAFSSRSSVLTFRYSLIGF